MFTSLEWLNSIFRIKTKIRVNYQTDIVSYSVHIRGGFRGGGAPGAPPLKLEKIRFFGIKSWFFTRNTPKFFAPPSARRNFFKCAPPLLEILDPPLHILSRLKCPSLSFSTFIHVYEAFCKFWFTMIRQNSGITSVWNVLT